MDLSKFVKFNNTSGRIAQSASHWGYAILPRDGMFADHKWSSLPLRLFANGRLFSVLSRNENSFVLGQGRTDSTHDPTAHVWKDRSDSRSRWPSSPLRTSSGITVDQNSNAQINPNLQGLISPNAYARALQRNSGYGATIIYQSLVRFPQILLSTDIGEAQAKLVGK